jgi:hypothetical protein
VQNDETNISAQPKKTGTDSWFFEKNVNQTGKKSYQQTQGKRKEAAGFIMIRVNPSPF